MYWKKNSNLSWEKLEFQLNFYEGKIGIPIRPCTSSNSSLYKDDLESYWIPISAVTDALLKAGALFKYM